MADSIEPFNEARNLARVGAGFRGGPFFNNPNVAPAVNVVSDGWPAGVAEKLSAGATTKETPSDPWVYRYPNAKL